MDQARLDGLVQAVVDELPGDYLLIGGALVALWLEPRRLTEDVDLVGMSGDMAQRLALLDLMAKHGWPVETVNSAADFFVFAVPDWRNEVELFRRGRMGQVFRPTPTLFLLLKSRRLSQQDLEDCLALLTQATKAGWSLDHERVLAALDALPKPADPEQRARRETLRRSLLSTAAALPR